MRWPFGLLQMDVKDLQDLPGYRELIPFGLPRFQFTARMVPEGTLWLAFSAVNDSTYALVFADRLLAHLARCGVDLRPLVVQTDNGSEFGGNWNRRHGLPPFTKLVEQKYGCRQHRFNPPHRSTYNSDVEAVHGIMEREFYELERFRGSVSAFLGQAYSYQLYFNLLRRNSAKAGRTPEQLRQARAPTVRPEARSAVARSAGKAGSGSDSRSVALARLWRAAWLSWPEASGTLIGCGRHVVAAMHFGPSARLQLAESSCATNSSPRRGP
jgi:hypothetical protein